MVVSGSLKQTGQTADLSLALIDAVNSRAISTRTLGFDPARPMDTKSDVVAELARMLNFELTPLEKKAVTAGDSNTPAAYRAYLEGRGLMARYDVEGNLDTAITAFKSAIATDPNYALAHAGLAEAYWRKLRITREQKMGDLAVASAETAVRLDPKLAFCQAILGQVYATVGKQQEGIAHLTKAIELAPANAEAPRQLARIYSEVGRFAEAEASYVSSTKARPTDWYGFLLLGNFYTLQQRWDDAERALRRAQTLTPDNEIVSRNLGGLYARQGSYQAAEKQLQRSLALNAKSSTAYAILAGVLFLQHRYQQAVDAVEGAIDLDPSSPLLWGNLGVYSKWAPGSGGKAEVALRKAVEMTEQSLSVIPDDYNSRANLAEYRARLKEFPAAFADLQKIPPAARKPLATRLVMVYELAGRRREAIQAVRDYITTPEAMRQIRDDPDLAALWSDPAFQRAIPAGMLKPGS
jgi:tetratricopeptide (TPR) repeat protein